MSGPRHVWVSAERGGPLLGPAEAGSAEGGAVEEGAAGGRAVEGRAVEGGVGASEGPARPASADPLGLARSIPLDDPGLGLPIAVRQRLAAWFQERPVDGFPSRPQLRGHVARGWEIARAVAAALGPEWAVRYRDERHGTVRFVCWGCGRPHWTQDAHGTPPHPVDIRVKGYYGAHPLRADGFDDFAPDDPAAALGLSEEVVDDLNSWADGVKTAMDGWLDDRDDGRLDAEFARLHAEGEALTERVAGELGPGRTVTFDGIQ